jgi:hypothetical protein
MLYFRKIYHLDPLSTAILYVVMTAATTWLLALAYKNTKVGLKHKVTINNYNTFGVKIIP